MNATGKETGTAENGLRVAEGSNNGMKIMTGNSKGLVDVRGLLLERRAMMGEREKLRSFWSRLGQETARKMGLVLLPHRARALSRVHGSVPLSSSSSSHLLRLLL